MQFRSTSIAIIIIAVAAIIRLLVPILKQSRILPAASMSEIEHANRHHWDTRVKDYDSAPWQKKMIAYIYGQVAEQRELFGLSTTEDRDFRLLDYACGPGTVTRALLPYVSHVQGIDVSDAMVAEYNERSKATGDGEKASAVQGNLLADEPYLTDASSGEKVLNFSSNPKFSEFDAVIVGLGFHHFPTWTKSLKTLSERVKPGGVVGIIDLAPSEKHWLHITEEQKKMMHKSGFTNEEMKEYMGEAGLVDFEMVWLPEEVTMIMKSGDEVQRRVFFARGRRQWQSVGPSSFRL